VSKCAGSTNIKLNSGNNLHKYNKCVPLAEPIYKIYNFFLVKSKSFG